MACVLSGDVSLRTGRDDLTVLLLNPDETKALTHIFATYGCLMPELDELANTMLGVSDE